MVFGKRASMAKMMELECDGEIIPLPDIVLFYYYYFFILFCFLKKRKALLFKILLSYFIYK